MPVQILPRNNMIMDMETPDIGTAPVVWSADCLTDGQALFTDQERCIIGTRDQRVIFFTKQGIAVRQFKLNNPVTAIFQDGGLLYAWCHQRLPVSRVKGSLFDISHDQPRHLLDVEDFDDKAVHAVMKAGSLAIGNTCGHIRVLGCTGHVIWEKTGEDVGDGGMFEADDTGLYVAHKRSVVKYSLETGAVVWEYTVKGARRTDVIHAGAQNEDSVFVETGGKVVQLGKESGLMVREFAPLRHRAAGVVVGHGLLITGEFPSVVFDVASGKELYRMMASIRFKDSVTSFSPSKQLLIFWDKLYNVDLTQRTINRAIHGKGHSRIFEFTVPPPEETAADSPVEVYECPPGVEETSLPGVVVECTEEDDGKVVAKRKTGGRKDWCVALPLDLLQNGHNYLVEELMPCDRAQYWRCQGRIQKLVRTTTDDKPENIEDDNQ